MHEECLQCFPQTGGVREEGRGGGRGEGVMEDSLDTYTRLGREWRARLGRNGCYNTCPPFSLNFVPIPLSQMMMEDSIYLDMETRHTLGHGNRT